MVFTGSSYNATSDNSWANQAFWGPVTSTLDFCEANYQFSKYIAEAANTVSNAATIALGAYGIAQGVQAKLPPRYLAGFSGLALVGVGSSLFHGTLLYEAQLADELPMIYVASLCCAILYDTKRGFGLETSTISGMALVATLFNVFFTWSYWLSRNPIYHEMVFGGLVFSNIGRTIYLMKSQKTRALVPDNMRSTVSRIYLTGVGMFAFAFVIWNLDNIFCAHVTRWKSAVGWPAALLLEGHSWWHILTALGTYLMMIGSTYLTLCIKDDSRNYAIQSTFGLPRVERVGKSKTA